MPRLTFVKKARKGKKGACRKCGTKIKAGHSYYWFANRIGRSSIRKEYCQAHRPRPSDMTTSDKLSQLYAAQETVEDGMDRYTKEKALIPFEEYRDSMSQSLTDAAGIAESVSQEYSDSLSNMPEGLQESSGIQEKVDSCETWQQELESAASEVGDVEQAKKLEEGHEEDAYDQVDEIANNAVGSLEL